MVKLRYIVTGTGRSGTVGLACALSSAGLYSSHERFFHGNSLPNALHLLETNGGSNSWCSSRSGLAEWGEQVVAESSYLVAPFLAESYFANTTIIHAVRNPWKVILSFVNDIQFFRGEPEHEHEVFIYAVLPRLHDLRSPIDRAIYYYLHWNQMIERLAQKQEPGHYFFHRVEDGPEGLLRQLGVAEEAIRSCLKKNDVNSFKDWQQGRELLPSLPRFEVEHIERSRYTADLGQLAQRYGYERPPLSSSERVEPIPAAILWENGWEWRFAQEPYLVETGYRGFNLVRWQRDCYAVHQVLGPMDLTTVPESILQDNLERGTIVIGGSPKEVKKKVDDQARLGSCREALLVETGYRGFNLVLWRGDYYGFNQSLGPRDLRTIPESFIQDQMKRKAILVGHSLQEVKKKVDGLARSFPADPGSDAAGSERRGVDSSLPVVYQESQSAMD